MKLKTPGLFMALLAALAACSAGDNGERSSAQSALGPTNVATVNGEPLAESVFRLYSMNSVQRNVEQLSKDQYDQLLDQLIQFKLLTQAARDRGLLDERTIAAELELQRMQLIARRMATRYLDDNPATEAELRAQYEENLPNYLERQYKARHILVDSEEEANDVIAALDDGADFAELAKERSTGSTATEGGELGYFSAESMLPAFSEAVQGLEVGNYSAAPVQTRYGWHVILLEDIKEQEPPGVEAVRDELKQAVERKKLEEFVESLRKRGNVTITPLE